MEAVGAVGAFVSVVDGTVVDGTDSFVDVEWDSLRFLVGLEAGSTFS